MMRSAPVLGAVLLALALPAPAVRAQEEAEPAEPREQREAPIGERPEYGGVVTSQVTTSLGALFNTRFTESWSRQPETDNYVLSLRERSSPRFGTEVVISHNDQVVFRAVLPRSFHAVNDLAESAARQVNRRLGDLAIERLLFEDADLAPASP